MTEEAKALLESDVFQYAMNEWKAHCVNQIAQNPLDSVEASVGLAMQEQFIAFIEGLVFNEELEAFNEAQSKKYK